MGRRRCVHKSAKISVGSTELRHAYSNLEVRKVLDFSRCDEVGMCLSLAQYLKSAQPVAACEGLVIFVVLLRPSIMVPSGDTFVRPVWGAEPPPPALISSTGCASPLRLPVTITVTTSTRKQQHIQRAFSHRHRRPPRSSHPGKSIRRSPHWARRLVQTNGRIGVTS
jgi:hypothetical protein